jgi:hypothetical protein
MSEPATLLFDLVDARLERAVEAACDYIYSERVDVAWTPDQRRALAASVRIELQSTIQGILGMFDNVGAVLPDGISGLRICRVEDGADIRVDNADYADMWLEFLRRKKRM